MACKRQLTLTLGSAPGHRNVDSSGSPFESQYELRYPSQYELLRWSCQNDAAEILSTLIEELRKTFVQWNVSCIKTRASIQCTECSSERLEEDVENPYLILSPKGKLVESLHKYMLPELSKGQICESCKSTKGSKSHTMHLRFLSYRLTVARIMVQSTRT